MISGLLLPLRGEPLEKLGELPLCGSRMTGDVPVTKASPSWSSPHVSSMNGDGTCGVIPRLLP